MGVTDQKNKPTSLKEEKKRVDKFITGKNQLNWMIVLEGTIVGSVWVDLEATEYLKAPSVHIMIGDPSVRGQGVGRATIEAVIHYLGDKGKKTIYSRHLTDNDRIRLVFEKLDFKTLGEPYSDEDGLVWQNVSRANEPHSH